MSRSGGGTSSTVASLFALLSVAGGAALLGGCRSKADKVGSGPPAPVTVTAETHRSPGSGPYRRKDVPGHTLRVDVRMAHPREAPRWPIPRMVQSQCGGADHVVDEALAASGDGGVEGAVVWLDDIREGKPTATASVTQDERRCAFEPHVLALPAEGTLTLTNSDPSNHAVRFDFGEGTDPLMKTLPSGGSVGVPIQEAWAGKVVRISCPIHLWMYGYALFFDHPYFAVTRDGAAELDQVPPGDYHLVVWHEGTTSTYSSQIQLSPPRTLRVPVSIGASDVKLTFTIDDDGTITKKE